MPVSRRMWEGVQGASPCQHPTRCCPSQSSSPHAIKVSVFRVNQLLSACNANNAENAGVRCANANNRGANTNANYGFPLYMPFNGKSSVTEPCYKIKKRNTETLPHKSCQQWQWQNKSRFNKVLVRCRGKSLQV